MFGMFVLSQTCICGLIDAGVTMDFLYTGILANLVDITVGLR